MGAPVLMGAIQPAVGLAHVGEHELCRPARGAHVALVAQHRAALGQGVDSIEIYVMKADGSDVLRLTHNGVKDSDPSWSPR